MKTFTDEERCQISEDWLRNGNLKEKARLERVAELHACTPKEGADCLGIEMPKPKKKLASYDKAVHDDALKAVLLDGESTRTVAERFGVPLSTVATWVSKAKKTQKEFLDYPEPEFLDDLEPEPEKAKAEPEEVKQAPEETKPAGEPAAGRVEAAVDLKALEDAADGLLTFTDLFEEVGFLTAWQRRFIDEMADQAHHYAAGIRWALERR